MVDLYRRRFEHYGHGPADQAIVGLGGQVFMRADSQAAIREFRPYFDHAPVYGGGPSLEDYMDQTPLTVGSPQQVIDRTMGFREIVGDYQRQLFLVDHAGLPPKVALEQLEMLGEQVVPVLRKEFAALKPAHVPEAPTHASRLAARAAADAAGDGRTTRPPSRPRSPDRAPPHRRQRRPQPAVGDAPPGRPPDRGHDRAVSRRAVTRSTSRSSSSATSARDLVDHLLTGFPSPRLGAAIASVRGADGLIAVTPIFNASYSGLFKLFFDVLEQDALAGVPVLIGATGGTARHSLALDHAMRPMFAYLDAAVVPTAVFAATEDWGSETGGVDGALTERIERAARDLVGLDGHPRPERQRRSVRRPARVRRSAARRGGPRGGPARVASGHARSARPGRRPRRHPGRPAR